MRRKLWLLVILFLFLVGRESCCASQEEKEQDIEQNQGQDIVQTAVGAIVGVSFILYNISYWYFDLHQKEEGWYNCKFYYASGYRTKLFFNRIYLDFYYSYFWLAYGFIEKKPFSYLFIMNINVRIYRDIYIVIPITVLDFLFSMVGI